MHIMCDHEGSLHRNVEIDRDLLATLSALQDMGHLVTFVTADPISAGIIYALETELNIRWQKRSGLSEDARFVDFLVDDQAETNIREYALQVNRTLDPKTAAHDLREAISIPADILEKHRQEVGYQPSGPINGTQGSLTHHHN